MGKAVTFRDKQMSRPERSSGVLGVACSGRYVVQDGRSNTVVVQNQRVAISEERNANRLYWKSEGFIVPIAGAGQHNLP